MISKVHVNSIGFRPILQVLVNQSQPSIEHLVLERRLSHISANGGAGTGNGNDFAAEIISTSRSPRSSSIRRRSEMPNTGDPVVVTVPMPQLQPQVLATYLKSGGIVERKPFFNDYFDLTVEDQL